MIYEMFYYKIKIEVKFSTQFILKVVLISSDFFQREIM